MNQSKNVSLNELIKNPYPFYEDIRSISPVYKGSMFKYPGWYVTGYKEASFILKDSRFQTRLPLPETTRTYEHLKSILNDMMLYKNPPDHHRFSKLVRGHFTPRALEVLHPYIEEQASLLLQHVKNQNKLNVISDFAFPLASTVIAKILGVPEEEKKLFRKWALSLIHSIDLTRSREEVAAGDKTIRTMVPYFRELIRKRKEEPKDDLISFLSDEPEEELVSTCILLVIAGHETTVNLIANSVYCLVTNRGQLNMLTAHPFLIDPAIEECLRYESPTQLTARIASEQVKVGSTVIHQGDHVYVMIGAANRDPKQFSNATVFNISRQPNPHLSFGAGIHFCLGATLARIEAKLAIQAFLQNTTNVQIKVANVEWRHLVGFRALKELHLVLY
ncbi:cytochrome P450 [Halalkalibacter urbisdiaboli]|uniref:cytochrome P450 n=1 Tax=Halalkalibacter urbisdiaboli TaxID=1960589 RepID=UPI000B438423|nr:cytochrome P450 [Halalkalibacter urbisdiaboli]